MKNRKDYEWELLPYNCQKDVPEYCLWIEKDAEHYGEGEAILFVQVRLSGTDDAAGYIALNSEEEIEELIARLQKAKEVF